MKLKTWQWVVLGAICYIVFLIKYLPANWLINSGLIPIDKSIQIQGIEGTVWNGSADQITAKGINVSGVTWNVFPSAMLLGRLNLQFNGGHLRESDSVYADGELVTFLYNLTAIELIDTNFLVPAEMVLSQVPLPVPVTAKGRFKANIDKLEFDNTCNLLAGDGGWNNGVVAGSQGPIEFGTFNAALSCADGNLIVAVKPDNKFEMDAEITLKSDATFTVMGRFKVPQDMPAEVKQGATFFGAPDSEGFRVINL